MCGIAGIANLRNEEPPPREALERMLGALSHRGPDAFGLYRDELAGLAHSRLSIIDPSGGQQPMASADGSIWITFNGEIFNYLELRAELEAQGHSFRTRSDTEVFATAYAAWGEEALGRLNGQFAAALWRPREGTLALVRDRLGIRPLFYAIRDGRLYFASEIKALFAADRALSRELDPVGIDEVFTFWTHVAPRTAFRDVREVEPGCVYTYQREGARGRAYWSPRYEDDPDLRSLSASSARVEGSLERATSLRALRADVSVGCYLSGGLDSSLIAELASRERDEPIRTFSIRFEDAHLDEGGYQREMARYLGSRHSELSISQLDIARAFPAVIRHAERPVLRTAPAPLYLLSRLVRDEGIKVVLTGEGADESFAGYDLFREGAVRRFWARAPHSELRPRLLGRLYPYLARSPAAREGIARQFFGRGLDSWREPGFAHGPRWDTTSALKRLLSREFRAEAGHRDARGALFASLPEEFFGWSYLAQDQYLEARTLLSGYLLSAQGDRMLMAHSVEGRFPFLDPDLVELAGRLPDAHKLRGLDEKHILKRIAAQRLPPGIVRRKKQPYRAPDAAAFARADAPVWVTDALSPEAIRDVGALEEKTVSALWRKCLGRGGEGLSNADNMGLVAALSLQILGVEVAGAAAGAAPPARLSRDVDRVADAGVESASAIGRDRSGGSGQPGGALGRHNL